MSALVDVAAWHKKVELRQNQTAIIEQMHAKFLCRAYVDRPGSAFIYVRSHLACIVSIFRIVQAIQLPYEGMHKLLLGALVVCYTLPDE